MTTDKNELALSVVLKELLSIYLQWSHPFYTKFVPSPIQNFNSSLHLPSLLNHHWSIKNTGCWVAKSLSNDSWEMENKFSQFTMGKDEWPRSLRWALTYKEIKVESYFLKGIFKFWTEAVTKTITCRYRTLEGNKPRCLQ